MRSISFYPRLAAGNLWRNRSTYLPYLLACVVSIFTFYTLLSINTNGALNGMRQEGVVKSFTAIGTIIMAIFCAVLIFYTNSFLAKRRKKELGLYSILGMEKRNIGFVMFFESLFIAALSLVLGLALGMLFSKLLFWVLLRMVRFDVMLEMPISFSAIGITCLLFGVIFLLALLSNLRQVHIANPVDLMAGAKQGEKEPKASWLLTLIGVLCLGGGYFIALYFTGLLEVLMFFLLAVLLVIIGTYCLFTSGSIAVLKLLRKNKNYYYRPNHFISLSGMIYRMKQNAAGLATICILSCMVLVTVSATVSLNVGAEDSFDTQYPYEYSLSFDDARDADTLLAGAQDIARQSGATIAGLREYSVDSFIARGQNGSYVATDDDGDVQSISYIEVHLLEDYNRNEGTNVALGEGQALLLTTGGSYPYDNMEINGIPFAVQKLQRFGKVEDGGRDFTLTHTLVLPNAQAAEQLFAAAGLVYQPQRTLSFDLDGTEEAKQQFLDGYNAYIGGLSTNAYFHYRAKENGRDDWYATNGGFLFLGIYFGILFILAAALIIYYKQMSEGYDDAARFEILQKVGMGEAEVKKTINGQILAIFFLPLAVAIIHITVAFFPIRRAMIIFGVMNTPLLVVANVLTVLAYALIYLLVFRQTARTYFRIVRRQAATA